MVSEILQAYNAGRVLTVSGRVSGVDYDANGQVLSYTVVLHPFTIKKGDKAKDIGFGFKFSKVQLLHFLEKEEKDGRLKVRKVSKDDGTILYLIDNVDGKFALTIEQKN